MALLIETSNAYARELLHGIQTYARENRHWALHLTEQGRGEAPPAWLRSWRGDGLIARVAAGGVDEVVLAMNATLEGQTTAHYLAERLEDYPVRLTQLAHGVPVGGELDYLDDGTLAQALRARRPVGTAAA